LKPEYLQTDLMVPVLNRSAKVQGSYEHVNKQGPGMKKTKEKSGGMKSEEERMKTDR
jgi:hypothetical protein